MPAIEIDLPAISTDEELAKELSREEEATRKFEAQLDAAYERANAIKPGTCPEAFALGFVAGYENSR